MSAADLAPHTDAVLHIDPAFELDDVTYRVGERALLEDVSLRVRSGRVLSLVGPNGAGKSTLLGVMVGDTVPTSGRVLFYARPLTSWDPGELARRRSVLLQSNELAFSFSVRDVVAMGRAPWVGRSSAADDDAAIAAAVEAADVGDLLDRPFPQLSGGEKARVSLARVLAQDTPAVLLDEPTAALDLRHQERVMRVARQLARAGRAVVVVVHDLTLAAAHSDEIAVLSRGRLLEAGLPRDVLRAELLRETYETDVQVFDDPDGNLVILPRRTV